jgi:hypothetical protein
MRTLLLLFLIVPCYSIGSFATGATGISGTGATGISGAGATGISGPEPMGIASTRIETQVQMTVKYECDSFLKVQLDGQRRISIQKNSTIYPTGNFSIPHNCSVQFIDRHHAITRVNVLQENIHKRRYVSYSVDFKKYGETVRNTTHPYRKKYVTPDFIAKNPEGDFTYTFYRGRVYKYGYTDVENYITIV